MKATNLLYRDEKSIDNLIKNSILSSETEYLVRIFTSDLTANESVKLAEYVKSKLPKAKIIGSSSVGLMFNDELYENETMIIFEKYDYSKVAVKRFSWKNKTGYEMAKEVANFAFENNSEMIHILSSDGFSNAYDFVMEFNKLNSKTKLVGGTAGDIVNKDITAFVFDENGYEEYNTIMASISGKNIKINSWVNISHEPISEVYTLTEVEGDILKSINGEEAKEWFKEQLGFDELKDYLDFQSIAAKDEMVRFPIILENHNSASRFLKYDKKKDGICQYHSQLPAGTKFKIGYTNPKSIVSNTYEICRDFQTKPVESLFFYSCFFRKLYLNNCAKWEVSPYKGNGICGAFLMGEIGNVYGVNEFLNGSCVLVGVAENDVYIKPDDSVFTQLNDIEDETKDLLNYVLLKRSKMLSISNQKLLGELIEHQENMKNSLFFDSNTGFGNQIRYKEDMEKKKYNKLCMVRVENSESLITFLGHDGYKKAIKREALIIRRFIADSKFSDVLNCYSISDNITIITANDDIGEKEFEVSMNELFKKIHFFVIDGEESVLVNRFILVFSEKDLMESALQTLQITQYTQIPFMIYNQSDLTGNELSDEFKMISILSRAIENDGIVPYFQGVYNNNTGKTTKYEALMRVVDLDGKVYSLHQFMAIAKKYHMYYCLSRAMINKVLDLFRGRNEVVSINFSAFDINSDEMQSIIFEKLEETKDGSKIILEILEDEHFKNFDRLNSFVKKVREYGVKIAIDDFGAGYSNFLEIMEIMPDFIKIDGAIVKTTGEREVSDMLMDTIVFLGNRFNAELVAEFVENEDVQKSVMGRGISYSQGYYFSKPMPFSSIKFEE